MKTEYRGFPVEKIDRAIQMGYDLARTAGVNKKEDPQHRLSVRHRLPGLRSNQDVQYDSCCGALHRQLLEGPPTGLRVPSIRRTRESDRQRNAPLRSSDERREHPLRSLQSVRHRARRTSRADFTMLRGSSPSTVGKPYSPNLAQRRIPH